MKKTLIQSTIALSLAAIMTGCMGGSAKAPESKGLKLTQLGTYQTKVFAESAAEIVAYDKETKQAFVVNGHDNAVDILDVSNPRSIKKVGSISAERFNKNGFYNVGIQAVDVKNGMVAMAVSRVYPKDETYGKNRQSKGVVGIFDTRGNYVDDIQVGYLPDNLKFTKDGKTLVVANEGEPSASYTWNPEGTVSIIDMSNPKHPKHTEVGFSHLTYDELIKEPGLKLNKNLDPASDLEPEYVALDSKGEYAYIGLQEANAIAKIDLKAKKLVKVMGLGVKDHSLPENGMDVSNKDGMINIRPWPVLGLYQPDSIVAYETGGSTYIVGANEGDSKDYDGYSEETRVGKLTLDKHFSQSNHWLQEKRNLGRLKTTTEMGDTDGDGDFDKIYSYGGRSFSIWDENGKLVFDSGNDFEQITAGLFPRSFNSDDEENAFDDRSDDKGPEPEALDIGKVGERTYAFIGLERMGGIMVYDITDPHNVEFIQYVNNRNFCGNNEENIKNGTSGDVAPEGIRFIPASDSPNGQPMIIVASEVSGSTTLYAIGK